MRICLITFIVNNGDGPRTSDLENKLPRGVT